MRVHLKFAAYAGRRLFKAGVTDEWPDDVELPSTAKKLAPEEVVEESEGPEEEPEPDTLSELQKRSTGKK